MMDTLNEELSCSPPKRLAEAVKNEGRKTAGTLNVYTLPLEAQYMNVEGCKCFSFGKDLGKKNRTIMVLGATGAGKSTLINRMINYILGVTWDDTFRFKLVDEGTAKSQAHSQTSEVTVYKLNHREGFKIDHSLTIVDTPGFGDTRGIESDEVIVTQLQSLFSAECGVQDIDAICIVAQASLARLTETQKYVFDSVINIFGNDVTDNIRILVTFYNGSDPQVLTAINECGLPCPKDQNGLPIHFIFNNGEKKIPVANDDDDMGKIFWNKGTKNMENFFSALKFIQTKSLTLTKEVLRQRAQLEIDIENIENKMELSLAKLEEIKQESQILQSHEAEITANENCSVLKHSRDQFYWSSTTVKEKRSFKDLKAVADIIKEKTLERDLLEDEVVKLIERANESQNTLKQIALNSNHLSTSEYIDLLIEGEKKAAKPGCQERINKLQRAKGTGFIE